MQYMHSPSSLNTIWRVNQDCFDFYNTLEQREISFVILEMGLAFVSFPTSAIISKSLCNLSLRP